jgi:hypothetical protein
VDGYGTPDGILRAMIFGLNLIWHSDGIYGREGNICYLVYDSVDACIEKTAKASILSKPIR